MTCPRAIRHCLLATLLWLPAAVQAALVVNPPAPITHVLNVQPIIVSDDDGSNTAEYFGNAAQQTEIESLIDVIWSQAGIDVEFLAPNHWNSTFANEGAPGLMDPRPLDDIGSIVTLANLDGVTNADPSVINIYFVNIAAGFGMRDENTVAGLAFVGGNGITQYVGSNLLDSMSDREVVASVVAHELGHNLGLDHILSPQNLMQEAGSPNRGERISTAQTAFILEESQFVQAVEQPAPVPKAVPLPPLAAALLAAALGVLGVRLQPA
ncbi:MAG: zinc-dependent metalloprotease family protein [Gammaproteobacteria bacterium]